MFPKIKVRESPDSMTLFSYGSELVDYHENVISTPDTLDQTSTRLGLSMEVSEEGVAGQGRVWEAIIKAGEILLSECNTCEVDSYLGNTSRLTVVTASFSFAFVNCFKKSFFFFFLLECVFNLCIP